MKVLFAVSSESISEAIVKKYQKDYKEILSYKNVYYFNAILKEIQKDKTYDRIVISEDLESFSNNNYDAIDKFIFEKLDDISDEAQDIDGNETSIILICTDRHTKGSSFLVKLFGIGIYNALLGGDRSMEQVCKLINKPRNKKEAKMYYKVDANEVDYDNKTTEEVSELEIQNILTHFKKISRNTDKFADSFNNIASQYTDEQLKIIINCLPTNVKAVLEDDCKKYQELMTVNGMVQRVNREGAINQEARKQTGIKIDILDNKMNAQKMTGPIVIPASVRTSKNKGPAPVRPMGNSIEVPVVDKKEPVKTKKIVKRSELNAMGISDPSELKKIAKNADGQPIKKVVKPAEEAEEPKQKRVRTSAELVQIPPVAGNIKRKPAEAEVVTEKRGRGRPRKVEKAPVVEEEDDFILPGMLDFEEEKEETPIVEDTFEINEEILPGLDDMEEDDVLPGMEDEEIVEEDEEFVPGLDDEDEDILPGMDDDSESGDEELLPGFDEEDLLSPDVEEEPIQSNQIESIKPRVDYSMSNLNSLLTKDKKIVTFIGTSKNGTSFLVNNLAALFSLSGINTAILDMTKNKNSYYIYTNNEEELRKIAYNSISKLQSGGYAEGIKVNKCLSVYTALPNDGKDYSDAEPILSTLVQNHSLILIDCDYDTDPSYFASCQEIYLVQSMDILTIQPLTAFLRDLKSKGVLEAEKVRVVINKVLNVKSLTEKAIIGGMSFYNDPSMSFMTELFNKDMVKACSIPFDENVYSKYLDGIVNCKVSVNGYEKSRKFWEKFKTLGDMVYPLVGKSTYGGKSSQVGQVDYSKNKFSNNINNTLNQMKKKY